MNPFAEPRPDPKLRHPDDAGLSVRTRARDDPAESIPRRQPFR